MDGFFEFWSNFEEVISPLLPILIGIICYKKLRFQEKGIFFSLIVSWFFFAAIVYVGTFLHKRNVFLYHLLAPLDLFVFLWYAFNNQFIKKTTGVILFINYLIFAVINCFYLDTIYFYNGIGNGILQIIILFICLKSIMEIALSNDDSPFYKQSSFWMITGFFVFSITSCLSSVIYRFTSELQIKDEDALSDQIFGVKLFGSDLRYIIYTIAFLCKNKK